MAKKESKNDKLTKILLKWGWLGLFPSGIWFYLMYLDYSSQGRLGVFLYIACITFLVIIIPIIFTLINSKRQRRIHPNQCVRSHKAKKQK